jgi:hypothetical protein
MPRAPTGVRETAMCYRRGSPGRDGRRPRIPGPSVKHSACKAVSISPGRFYQPRPKAWGQTSRHGIGTERAVRAGSQSDRALQARKQKRRRVPRPSAWADGTGPSGRKRRPSSWFVGGFNRDVAIGAGARPSPVYGASRAAVLGPPLTAGQPACPLIVRSPVHGASRAAVIGPPLTAGEPARPLFARPLFARSPVHGASRCSA